MVAPSAKLSTGLVQVYMMLELTFLIKLLANRSSTNVINYQKWAYMSKVAVIVITILSLIFVLAFGIKSLDGNTYVFWEHEHAALISFSLSYLLVSILMAIVTIVLIKGLK